MTRNDPVDLADWHGDPIDLIKNMVVTCWFFTKITSFWIKKKKNLPGWPG
jgi:hypothetical protein